MVEYKINKESVRYKHDIRCTIGDIYQHSKKDESERYRHYKFWFVDTDVDRANAIITFNDRHVWFIRKLEEHGIEVIEHKSINGEGTGPRNDHVYFYILRKIEEEDTQ